MNNTQASSYKGIMSKSGSAFGGKKTLFLLLLAFLVPFISHAETKKSATYFYADWCSHCQKVDEYFIKQGFYEKYDIQKKNFDDPQNKKLLTEIFSATNYKGGKGIPAIIIDDKIFSGDEDIINNFEREIEKSDGTAADFIAGIGGKDKQKKTKDITLPLIFSAALSDAFNPCAFAVLILLVGTVLKAQGKRRAFWSGIMFSAAVFVSYFLMGLGLYKAITIFNIPKYFSIAIGMVAILIGLANLKDAFWYGKFFIMEVPLSWRPRMKEILGRVTNPVGAFFAGILVSLFLLPCSSGPYVVIVGLLAERADMAITVGKLILYNLIFVLPMVVISLGMYFFNLRMGEMEKMRTRNLKLLHAVVGAIMLTMGIYLINGWM